jgi:hypothetical protein
MSKAVLQRTKHIKILLQKYEGRIRNGHYVETVSDFSGSFDEIIAFNSYFMELLHMPYMSYIIEFLDNIGFLEYSHDRMHDYRINISGNSAVSYINKIAFRCDNIGHRALYDTARAANVLLPITKSILSNPLFINEIENYMSDAVWNKHFMPLNNRSECFYNTSNEIDKLKLSSNPAAASILKKHRIMINWEFIMRNPIAIEFVRCDSITDMQKKYAETQDPKLKATLYRKIVKEIISWAKKCGTRLPLFMYQYTMRHAEKKSISDIFRYCVKSYLSY